MSLGLVWAQAAGGVIGRDGALPWHLPEDLAHFREVTRGCTVLMGRATWESLPERYRPLPGRENLVLTRTIGYAAPGATVVHDLDAALAAAADRPVWVIGGGALYAATLARADRLEVTEIDLDVAGDTRAPVIGPGWLATDRAPATDWATSAGGLRYRFVSYRRD